jgi:type III pantothenate kinase
MDLKPKFLVIDFGNTDLKFGFFANQVVETGRGWDALKTTLVKYPIEHVLVSNVASKERIAELKKLIPHFLQLLEIKAIPLDNRYATPETLGQDRLANAVAIKYLKQDGAALSIDIGTCLKFDFVDTFGSYLGGSISPGLRMRFQALHHFTANLPLIEHWEKTELIGNDTKSSLVSGVIEGMTNEINETIRRYQEHNENLTIFLTGGDSVYFENAINCRIFADPNLTLHGLKIILEANV